MDLLYRQQTVRRGFWPAEGTLTFSLRQQQELLPIFAGIGKSDSAGAAGPSRIVSFLWLAWVHFGLRPDLFMRFRAQPRVPGPA